MYSKGKALQQQQQILPIESQAKDKLNIYVHEYLIHIGAKNTATTFLNEIRWEKPPIGDAPGFLISWWNVFWDLYCAATPERNGQFEPSNEAKVFHEYQGINDNLMMLNPNIQMINHNHNNFYNGPGQQPPNNPMMNPGPQFQRFNAAGNQRQIRMPMEFNPNNNMNPGGPNPMTPDQNRVQAGMSPISTPPGNRMQPGMPMQGQVGANQMNFNGAPTPQPIRGPPSQAPTPGLPNNQQMQNGPMSPMSMSLQQQQQQQQQRWNQPGNNNQVGPPQQGQPQQPGLQAPPPQINYNQPSSPIPYSNVQMGGHHGPGTPNLISSPQDTNGEFNNLMKNVPVQFQDQNIGHMVQMNPDMSMNNEIMDSIKHSPLPNLQVNRHQQGDEHSVAGQMADINYSNFNDPSLF